MGDRPFHPTGRARHGWDQARLPALLPGRGRARRLDWVAVRRDHLDSGSCRPAGRGAGAGPGRPACPTGSRRTSRRRCPIVRPRRPTPCCRPTNGPRWSRPSPRPGSTGPITSSCRCIPGSTPMCCPQRLRRRVAQRRVRAGGHRSRRLLADGVDPDAGAGGRRPAPAPVHVKLPVGITTLGALRLLPPRYLANAARAQRLLEQAAARHPALQGRLSVCDEQALVGLRRSRRSRSLRRQARSPRLPAAGLARRQIRALGRRAGVWCRSARSASCCPTARRRVSPGSSPTGATTPPRRRRPWTCSTTSPRVVSEVALACFGLGFMPELHGQNAVLACEGGRVAGIVLRDHDTVRLHRPWLAAAGLADPGYDVKPGAPNSLWAAGPEELLGWFQTLAVEVALQAIGRALVHRLRRRRGDGVAPPGRCGPGRPVGRRAAAGRRRDHRPAAVPRRHLADQARDRPPPRPGRHRRRQHAERHRPGREPVPGRRRPRRRTGRARRRRAARQLLPAGVGHRAGAGRVDGDDPLRPHPPGRRRLARLPVADGPPPLPSRLHAPDGRTRRARRAGPARRGRARRRHAPGRLDAFCGTDRARAPPRRSTSWSACPSPGRSIRGTPRTRSWRRSRACGSATRSTRRPRPPSGSRPPTSTATPRKLGASFPLHWIAVDPELLAEDRLDTVRSLDPPPALCDAAAALLGARPSPPGAAGAPGRCCPVIPGRREHLAAPSGGGRAVRRRPARGPRAARARTSIPPPRCARCGTRPPAGS